MASRRTEEERTKTGATYFTAEIVVPEDQLRVLRNLRGTAALRAGCACRCWCRCARTALGYALEPLVGSFWGSFREH